MSIIYFLIPIAIVLVLIAVGIFWAVRSEQFKDRNVRVIASYLTMMLKSQPTAV